MEGHRNVATFKDGINRERINFYREQGGGEGVRLGRITKKAWGMLLREWAVWSGCDATTVFPGHPGCLGHPAGYSCRNCRIGYSTGSTGSGSGSTAATAERTEGRNTMYKNTCNNNTIQYNTILKLTGTSGKKRHNYTFKSSMAVATEKTRENEWKCQLQRYIKICSRCIRFLFTFL